MKRRPQENTLPSPSPPWPVTPFLHLKRLLLATAAMSALAAAGAEQTLRWTELAPGVDPPAALPRWQKMLHPDGHWQVLSVEPSAAATSGNTLTVPAGRIRWAGVRPSGEKAAEAPASWLVVGDLHSEPVSIEEWTPMQVPPSLLPVPPGLNLVDHLAWTPFGVEERAKAGDEPGRFAWKVTPGTKPAGFYTAAPWRLPQSTTITAWKLELTLRGQGQVMLGIATETSRGFPDPTPLSTLELAEKPKLVSFTLPEKLTSASPMRLSLVPTSPGGAEGVIETVAWHPASSPSAGKTSGLKRGVWDWSTQPDVWLKKMPAWKAAGISILQLALPRELGDDAGPLASALSRLRQDGFSIVAVEGDPHMILPQARAAVLERHQSLCRWQGSLLDGVQYDVEPYLLPGFQLQTGEWLQRWLDLYRELTRQDRTMPVEPVLPFWLIAQQEAAPLLKGLARCASRLVIMNYRSDAVEAAAWGAAWLEWSQQHDCPVALAVECGPLPDSKSAVFHKAEHGTLWMAPWPGRGTVAVVYENPVPAEAGGLVYALSHEGRVPGDRTTLRDRPPGEVGRWLEAISSMQARIALPARLQPSLLLHEPSAEVLQQLAMDTP